MQVTIHRGSQEIGGSCVEVRQGETSLLLDLGLPLADDASAALPVNPAGATAILISHSHPDHAGLLEHAPATVPVYLGALTHDLLQASRMFADQPLLTNRFAFIQHREPVQVGELTVTPFLVDHSAPDAYAFLIQGNGKSLLYSGDFRMHGRKGSLVRQLLSDPPSPVDALLLEGTMIGGDSRAQARETDVETRFIEELKTHQDKLAFLLCSGQNLDRLVSAYKAAQQAGRILVLDIYTAWILEQAAQQSDHIPTMTWRGIRVLNHGYPAGRHYGFVKKNPDYFGTFQQRMYDTGITMDWQQLVADPGKYLVKTGYANWLLDKLTIPTALVLYSMWEGYLKAEFNRNRRGMLALAQDPRVTFVKVHAGGHASVADLRRYIAKTKPGTVIPIHSAHAERYRQEFANAKVVLLQDKQVFDLHNPEEKTIDTKLQRYFSCPTANGAKTDFVASIKKDFAFLIKAVRESRGELDMQLRKDYFNIYYRGNSMAKVTPRRNGYVFETSGTFKLIEVVKKLKSPKIKQIELKESKGNARDTVFVPADCVHSFFQKKVRDELQKNIAATAYSEELAFEHTLIADNLDRPDFIIIDRQVEASFFTGRMDLLALRRQPDSTYKLQVLELKVGNNRELNNKVGKQLQDYIDVGEKNFTAFSNCYTETYRQKRFLGLIPGGSEAMQFPDEISIVPGVEGRTVVGMYTGLANLALQNLAATEYKKFADTAKVFSHFLPIED